MAFQGGKNIAFQGNQKLKQKTTESSVGLWLRPYIWSFEPDKSSGSVTENTASVTARIESRRIVPESTGSYRIAPESAGSHRIVPGRAGYRGQTVL